MKRMFIIVLDSFGVGAMPDSEKFGDEGVNTFRSCFNTGKLCVPNMKKLGLFNIDGMDFGEKEENPIGAFTRLSEKSMAKDSTVGHWEIAGLVTNKPLPTYPEGFPDDVIEKFCDATGRGVLCNKPYSGTDVIRDYGAEHIKNGKLIVYTSADSVFQIAAHEDVVPIDELYSYCEKAREILSGEHGVGRVIARPFNGEYPGFKRTDGRHDYSIAPPYDTMLDVLGKNGYHIYTIGKIYDLFNGKGINEYVTTKCNSEGMEKAIEALDKKFEGLCFVNLVDFDTVYGHRRDADGYAKALNEFDKYLGEFMSKMKDDDHLIITADHGCDPGYTKSTDHTREYVPVLEYSKGIIPCNNGTKTGFDNISKTVYKYFNLEEEK